MYIFMYVHIYVYTHPANSLKNVVPELLSKTLLPHATPLFPPPHRTFSQLRILSSFGNRERKVPKTVRVIETRTPASVPENSTKIGWIQNPGGEIKEFVATVYSNF